MVRDRAGKPDLVGQSGRGDLVGQLRAQRSVPDDLEHERRCGLTQRAQEDRESLLLDESANRQQPEGVLDRLGSWDEAAEIHAVRNQLDLGIDRTQRAGHVVVAGDYAGRASRAAAQDIPGDLADVARVGAERVGDADGHGRALGDLTRGVGEVGVHTVDRGRGEATRHPARLCIRIAGRDSLHAANERLDPGLRRASVSGLGGEYGLDRAGAIQGQQLIERERLGDPRKTARDHGDPRRAHVSTAPTARSRTGPLAPPLPAISARIRAARSVPL